MKEWQRLLGSEFPVASRLLRPTDRRVNAYPCPSPGGDGCPRRVVVHDNGQIVAVCNDVDQGCRDIRLSPEDIIAYELDRRGLGLAAALALGVKPDFSSLEDLWETYRIGEYRPRAGRRFPVFMTIQQEKERFEAVILRLCQRTESPFLLLAPTENSINPTVVAMMKGRHASFIPLQDVLVADRNNRLVPSPDSELMLSDFHLTVFPESDGPTQKPEFPTPPDAQWNQVSIRFVDGHTVSVHCLDKKRQVNYTQMGLVDGRNGNPTKQWELLRDLADGYGRIEVGSGRDRPENQKRKELLNKQLQQYFQIDGDPILWDPDSNAYRSRFELHPDE